MKQLKQRTMEDEKPRGKSGGSISQRTKPRRLDASSPWGFNGKAAVTHTLDLFALLELFSRLTWKTSSSETAEQGKPFPTDRRHATGKPRV